MTRLLRTLTLAGLVLTAATARAQLTIEITRGVESALPIAVVPFAAQGSVPQDIAAIVSANLARSGRFDVLPREAYNDRPSALSQVNPELWRAMRVDNVVVGQVVPSPAGFTVQVELGEVFQGQQLLAQSFTVGADQLRRVAHRISDLIYERLTGEPGAFDTRIAYVTQQGGTYSLVVADSDGHNPVVVLRSTEPVMSPAWSPEGARLAYVSFEGKRAQVVVQDVYTGQRQVIAAHPGINGAPAWSPDGQRIALTLSRDGNPEIYVTDVRGGSLRRITENTAIDTEPAWSPDSRYIYFTSDRGGGPQIYRVSATGGAAERVTFEGSYNSRASLSPDGNAMALVHRRDGRFHIAVMDLRTRQLRILSPGGLEESPSMAPNGRMVIYANGRGGLAAVSVDGRVQQRLEAPGADVREPAWSPRLR